MEYHVVHVAAFQLQGMFDFLFYHDSPENIYYRWRTHNFGQFRQELSGCEVSRGFRDVHFKDVRLCSARQLQGVKIFQCEVALSTAPKKAVERSTESLSSHLSTWTLGLLVARYGAPKLSVSTRVADGGDRHHVKHQTHHISPQTISSDRNWSCRSCQSLTLDLK